MLHDTHIQNVVLSICKSVTYYVNLFIINTFGVFFRKICKQFIGFSAKHSGDNSQLYM